jgi:type IV fimbrial biogenesis protein FimT
METAINRRGMLGVTLVEMLTVILIAAILMAIGIPSYRSVTNSNRIASEVNGLLGDLQFARGEAIKEGQTVTACASTDGVQCTASNSWRNGWIVFSDPNANANVDSAAEAILRVQGAFSGTDTFLASNNTQAFTFNREGVALGIAGGRLITLHDSTSTSTWTRCLAVSMVGLMATRYYDGSTCT